MNFNLNIIDFLAASFLYTIILVFVSQFSTVKLYITNGLAKNKINSYTQIGIISTLVIIYKDDLNRLVNNPPDYAFYSAFILATLAYTLNSYKERLEVNRVFTQDQTTLLKEQNKNIQDTVDDLEDGFETLKSDVNTLKLDVNTLKSDVNTLKLDVNTLKLDVGDIKDILKIILTKVEKL
jgi:uncharacterized protein YoxC